MANLTREEFDRIALNIWDYADDRYPIQIFVGSRGYGKTYSALRGLVQTNHPAIYMRRTLEDLNEICDSKRGEGLNPFKPLNRDFGWNIGFEKYTKKSARIIDRENPESDYGYGLALTAVATIRGLNAEECDDWFYDEFIPEKHVRTIAGEGEALVSAYETFARNREIMGLPPMRLWMFSNSNDIYNPYFKTLGLVHDAEVMVRTGEEHKYYPKRKLALHILKPNPEFERLKSQTTVQQLMAGTDWAESALGNKFSYNDFSLIKFQRIKGWRPVCALDEGYFYCKNGENLVHCCYAKGSVGSNIFNSRLPHDLIAFKRSFGILFADLYPQGKITFESYELKAVFLSIMFGGIK